MAEAGESPCVRDQHSDFQDTHNYMVRGSVSNKEKTNTIKRRRRKKKKKEKDGRERKRVLLCSFLSVFFESRKYSMLFEMSAHGLFSEKAL